MRRIAILGAESTGKSWLAQALSSTLRARGQAVCTVDEVLRQWCAREGRTPLPHEQMGIATEQARAVEQAPSGWVVADTTPLMTAVYSQLLFDDDSLYPMALAHQALYNSTLVTGLDLPWLPGEDDTARTTRENAQFAINEGRTVWQCNECSDPECEHKLFTGLLAKRSD
jgi:nicotinamide riboside kinase